MCFHTHIYSYILIIDVDNNDHNPTSKLPKPPRSVFQRLKPRINQEYTPMQCKNEKEMKLIIGFLHRIIKPFVLRRTRNEVSLHLPTKVSIYSLYLSLILIMI